MQSQDAYAARLDAQLRAADARLDQMEAQARAHGARVEMDEISGLRARRDKARQQLDDVKREGREDWEAARRNMEDSWTDFRRSVAESHRRYVAWDDARERKFTARLDEIDGALRESAARDAEVAADARIDLADARQELGDKATAARQSYSAWRARRADQKLQDQLAEAELELDEASNRYMAARGAANAGVGGRSS
jgi:hypothetical protein